MTEQQFDTVIETTLENIRNILVVKGKEYRRNENPFHNFEEGSKSSGLIREKVLDGFLLKHEISIKDITNDLTINKLPTREVIEEKFNDNIIYLLLKKAMFIDRITNK